MLRTRAPLVYPRRDLTVRLACVKPAASVRPEPGSNSPSYIFRIIGVHELNRPHTLRTVSQYVNELNYFALLKTRAELLFLLKFSHRFRREDKGEKLFSVHQKYSKKTLKKFRISLPQNLQIQKHIEYASMSI